MTNIQSMLDNLFRKHRIVFWYDNKSELRDEFESLLLPGVELIELANNEFGVKYRILRLQPNQKFLIYHEGPFPADLENWLLDVQLAHAEFRADQAALWLAELGLGPEYLDLVQIHAEFFNVELRRESLKIMLSPDDTSPSMRVKMLSVCARCEPRIDEILEALLGDLAGQKYEKINLIQACNLDSFLWDRLERAFGYHSDSPSLPDFALTLFQSCYQLGIGQPARLNNDALVFMKRWKDSLSQHPAFETLSAEYAALLNIQDDLQMRDYRALIEIDLFRLVDQKILSELAHGVAERTLPTAECSNLLRQRRRSHWYADFQHLYESIDYAPSF